MMMMMMKIRQFLGFAICLGFMVMLVVVDSFQAPTLLWNHHNLLQYRYQSQRQQRFHRGNLVVGDDSFKKKKKKKKDGSVLGYHPLQLISSSSSSSSSSTSSFSNPEAEDIQSFRSSQSHLAVTLPKDDNIMDDIDNNDDDTNKKQERLPFYFDIGTKGGVIVAGIVSLVVPFLLQFLITHIIYYPDKIDELVVGTWIGGIFTATLCLGWTSTLIVRIINKDMTYAKQLQEYETAVLQKRLEELSDDETLALLEDIDRQ